MLLVNAFFDFCVKAAAFFQEELCTKVERHCLSHRGREQLRSKAPSENGTYPAVSA